MHRFILFEGIDGTGKTTLAKMLAEKIGGVYYKSPPEILEPLATYAHDASPEIRYHYFLLGNYISAREIQKLLVTDDVVVDQYIYSTIAFHSILMNRDLMVPDDILMPDHVIHLTAPFEEIEERLNSRSTRNKYEASEFLKKVYQKYVDIFAKNQGVLMINTGEQDLSETCGLIEKHVRSKTS